MSSLRNLSNKAKKNNVIVGIVIFDIIAILYFVFPFFILYYGDLEVILGVIIGMIFAFRNIKPNQGILKIYLYFLFLGTFIVSLTLSIIFCLLLILYGYVVDTLIFLSLFVTFIIMVFIIVLIIGGILGYYYSNKIKNAKKTDDLDNFFGDLAKK